MKKLILLLPLYVLYLYFNTYNGEDIYSKSVYIDGNSVYVKKINNKLIIKKQFEYNNYEITKNGHYIIYLKDDRVIYIKESILNKFRYIISNRIDKYFFNDIKDISKLLILNEKDNFNKSRYIDLGISHLISISGLHISIIFMIFNNFLGYIIKNDALKNILILLLLTLYTMILGHNPPITRAYLMISIILLSKIIKKDMDIRKSYFISLISNLIINPYQIMSISFIFTYLSLFILIFINIKNIVLKSIVLQMFLLPIDLYIFKSTNLLSFIFNIILIPIYSVFIHLLFLIFIIPNKFLVELVNMYYISLRYIIEFFYYYNIFTIKLNISIIFALIYYIILIYCIIIFKMLK